MPGGHVSLADLLPAPILRDKDTGLSLCTDSSVQFMFHNTSSAVHHVLLSLHANRCSADHDVLSHTTCTGQVQFVLALPHTISEVKAVHFVLSSSQSFSGAVLKHHFTRGNCSRH